jgi:hypothetical protein
MAHPPTVIGRGPVLVLHREMIESAAWHALKGKSAQVYIYFRAKARLQKKKDTRQKRDHEYVVLNNGELVFTYAEALSLGITKRQFAAAISDLVKHGLLDITRTGRGQYKLTTLYAFSNRWRDWGKDSFEQHTRIPAPRAKRTPPKLKVIEKAV